MEHFGASTEAVAKYKKMVARSDARQALLRKQELETETGQQIKGALGGIGEGLSALFSEKEAPPERERPAIPMKYVEPATEGQWGKDDHNWDLIRMGMDARDQERAQQEKEMGRSNGSRGHFDAGHV